MNQQVTIKEKVHKEAMNIIADELIKNNVVYFSRPVARFRAKELRQSGVLCKSINAYTLKFLN